MPRHAACPVREHSAGQLTRGSAQVTVDDIAGYERTYRGSAEEERDLKELFTRFGGDMSQCVCVAMGLFTRAPTADARRCTGCLTGCAARARTWIRTASWTRCARRLIEARGAAAALLRSALNCLASQAS